MDVFGITEKGWAGVQCKQKSGLLRHRLSSKELRGEVEKAKGFRPPLNRFVVATTGPRDVSIQDLARALTEEHWSHEPPLFSVVVWAWDDIWSELYSRPALFSRLVPVYWPQLFRVRGKWKTGGPSHQQRTKRTRTRLLFLAATPADLAMLDVAREIEQVEARIRASANPRSIEIATKWAVQADGLLQALNECRPHVVHFSGHGSSDDAIYVVGNDNRAKRVTSSGLRALFSALKDDVRLVVLNACFSRQQASAITESIDCAIGMNGNISDEAAIVFSASLYRALAFGRSVENAFRQAVAALELEGVEGSDIPELVVKSGVDPARVFLLEPRQP